MRRILITGRLGFIGSTLIRDPLPVNRDIGIPAPALNLARAEHTAIGRAVSMQEFPCRVHHLCNASEITWHGFAEAIFEAPHASSLGLLLKSVEGIP
jgi:dTDP-4-dehydrorhamnose reductase